MPKPVCELRCNKSTRQDPIFDWSEAYPKNWRDRLYCISLHHRNFPVLQYTELGKYLLWAAKMKIYAIVSQQVLYTSVPKRKNLFPNFAFFLRKQKCRQPQKALIPCDISGFLSQSVSFMWWASHRQRKRSGSVLSQPHCRRSEPFLSRQRRIPASQGCFPAGENWW